MSPAYAGWRFAWGILRPLCPCWRPDVGAECCDVLHLIAVGHTNAQIAHRLGVSEGTVRTHLENIYARLQVSSRTAAVTRAFPDRVA
jgi:hypothetical protein